MTVPYAPLFDDVRSNHGFVDLRGRPKLVSRIPESSQSPALNELLVMLAQPGSSLWTLGCDLGDGKTEPEPTPHIAGGYVQVLATDYSPHSLDAYFTVGQFIAQGIEDRCGDHNWELQFVHTWVNLGIDGPHKMTSSVFIWFHARAGTAEGAARSREALINCLADALCKPEIVQFLQEAVQPEADEEDD